MRLVATSDWHGHLPDTVSNGDVLVIAGDTLSLDHRIDAQRQQFQSRLVPFLEALPHERILLVAGNHDFLFDDPRRWRDSLPAKVTYLLDEAFEIDGVRFWGTPWSTYLEGWVFMDHEERLAERWAAIVPDTDVLIVHGPPFLSLDRTAPQFGSIHVGSPSLRVWIEQHQPRAVVCGHIHEEFGVDRIGSTTVYNVSYLDASYEHGPEREPVVIDVAASS